MMSKFPTLQIVELVGYPKPTRPFRLIETFWTVDGPRSRVCDGSWSTFDEAQTQLNAKVEARNE